MLGTMPRNALSFRKALSLFTGIVIALTCAAFPVSAQTYSGITLTAADDPDADGVVSITSLQTGSSPRGADPDNLVTTTITGTTTLELTNGGIYFGSITDGTPGQILALKNSGGNLFLGNALTNTYSGGTTVENAFLTINSATTDNALGTGKLTLRNGGWLISDSINANITSTRNIEIFNSGLVAIAGSGIIRWNGNITDLNPGSELVRDGPGTLILGGTVDPSIRFRVAGGTLQGSTTQLRGNIEVSSPGSLTIFDQGGAAGAYNGNITGNGTITIQGGAGSSVTYNGTNTYAGITTVRDNATLILGSAVNDAQLGTGSLALDTGTLRLGAGADFATSRAVNITTAGTIDLAASRTVTWNGIISNVGGPATLIKDGIGTLNLGGNNAAGINYQISNGILMGNTTSLKGDIAVNNAASAVVFDQGGGAGDYNGDISGTGGVTIQNGTVTYQGTNNHAGGTRVEDAELVLTAVDDSQLGTGDLTLDNGTVNFGASAFATSRDLVLDGDGVLFASGAGTIIWNGQITGAGQLVKSGTNTLALTNTANVWTGGIEVASGTLSGNADTLQGDIDILALGILDFNQTANGTFSGDISGAGSMTKTGAGTVVLAGANSGFTGTTTVSAGTLQGDSDSLYGDIVNNSFLVFDQAASGTYADDISGTGTVTKTGAGTLTFSGTHTAGTVQVSAGTLNVTGSLAGNTSIASNAVLTGTGNIGDVTSSSGTILVGTGNTLTAESYTNGGNAGTLSFGLSPTQSGLLRVNGNADFTGTTIDIQPVAGGYTAGYVYTVADVLGITSGADALDGQVISSPLVSLVVNAANGAAQQVTLTTVSVDLTNNDACNIIASTSTQRSVCQAFLQAEGSSADIGVAYGEFQILPSVAEMQRALDLMSGDVAVQAGNMLFDQAAILAEGTFSRLGQVARQSSVAGAGSPSRPVQLASLENSPQQLAMLFENIDWLLGTANMETPHGTWGRVFGQMDDAHDGKALNGFRHGIQAGMDMRLDDHWSLGATALYGQGDADLDSRLASVNTDSYMMGAYGVWNDGPLMVGGTLSWGYHDVDTDRQIVFGGLNRRAEGDFSAHSVSAAVEASYVLSRGGNVSVIPAAGLRYTGLWEEGFTETGAGDLNLRFDEDFDSSFVSTLGVTVNKLFELGDGSRLLPEIRLGWEHEFETSRARTAFFTGLPTSAMDIYATSWKRDTGIIGAGLTYSVPADGLALVADYRAVLNQDQTSHRLLGGLRLSW